MQSGTDVKSCFDGVSRRHKWTKRSDREPWKTTAFQVSRTNTARILESLKQRNPNNSGSRECTFSDVYPDDNQWVVTTEGASTCHRASAKLFATGDSCCSFVHSCKASSPSKRGQHKARMIAHITTPSPFIESPEEAWPSADVVGKLQSVPRNLGYSVDLSGSFERDASHPGCFSNRDRELDHVHVDLVCDGCRDLEWLRY